MFIFYRSQNVIETKDDKSMLAYLALLYNQLGGKDQVNLSG